MNHMFKHEVQDAIINNDPMIVKTVVEIGKGWGESMLFFSQRYFDATVFTIDSFGLYGDGRIYSKWDHDQMKKIADLVGTRDNVIQILGNSQNIKFFMPIDILFIDGDHTFKGCKSDFITYGQWVRSGGIICFDDYTQENNPDNGVKASVEYALSTKQFEMVYCGYYCAILKKL